MDLIIKQRFEQIESHIDRLEKENRELAQELREEIKELNRRVNSHDKTLLKFELVVERMEEDWTELKNDIQTMIKRQQEVQNNMAKDKGTTIAVVFKEIIIELFKMVIILVGAFLGVKTFL